MIMRRTVKAVATTGILGLAMVGLAAPAHAENAVTFSGNLSLSGDSLEGGAFTPSSVFASTVTVRVTAVPVDFAPFEIVAPGVLANESGEDCAHFSFACEVSGTSPISLRIDPSAANSIVQMYLSETFVLVDVIFTVSYADATESSSDRGPSPHIQQFPMPETGTCDEAEPEGVNWSGVASGGWGESWAQWMNDGEGGFVCTRTLVYNASTAAWEVD